MTEPIRDLARRVETDPFFLASALRTFAESEGLDEAGLAAYLGCVVGDLPRLALCRRPNPNPPFFAADVEAIARHFAISGDRLAELVRRADALAALAASAESPRDFLQAARDREPGPADETSDLDNATSEERPP